MCRMPRSAGETYHSKASTECDGRIVAILERMFYIYLRPTPSACAPWRADGLPFGYRLVDVTSGRCRSTDDTHCTCGPER